MGHWRRVGLVGAAALAALLAGATASAGPALTLDKTVQPGSLVAGGEVTYTITATNAGDADLSDLEISDTLPAGFSYRSGSATVSLNGTYLGAVEPTVSGATLTWRHLRLPAARSGTVYGMHTFFHDRCEGGYIDYQLDRVREVAGPGAYVKQLLYWITPQTPGPQACWVHFVYGAYERGLIPIVRLQGEHGGSYWVKPQPDPSGGYGAIAQAYKRVVAGLPRRENRPLYVEVWNEPNLAIEWSGAPNPAEYGHFLADVSAAIRSLGDSRIVILNGGLSPGGDYNNLDFIDAMAQVPGALGAFDVWATHPYPGNHPPEYNIHDRTATYRTLTIDSYLLELERLAARGRSGLRVLLTETGYALGQNDFGFEGYPPIGEENRASYIARALGQHWSRWPEVLGACPYELVDPHGGWWVWDWLYPDGRHHWQFDTVAGLDKRPTTAPSVLTITFRARTASLAGTYTNAVAASAGGTVLASRQGLAPVLVRQPTATPTPTALPTLPTATPGPSPTPTQTPVCQEVLANGGFEAEAGWQPMGGVPAGYSLAVARSGARSLRLGLEGPANVYCYSSAEQELTLPAGPASATLSFWYRVASDDPTGDRAYVLLRDASYTYRTLGTLDLSAPDWTHASFDTSAYLGQLVAVRLTAVNDGAGGTTAVYVDDASWAACGGTEPWPAPTPTATPLPTATATPTPTVQTGGCAEGLGDGGFEAGDAWTILDTAYRAAYVEQPVHSGGRALRLGIAEGADVLSYSSAEQAVTIPAQASAARLSFWVYRATADREGDVQYLLLLDEGGGYESLLWGLVDERGWRRLEYALDDYRGQRVVLRFGVRNDGDGTLTSMVVDDVALAVCHGTTPTPYPMATPTPTATRAVHARAQQLPLIVRERGPLVLATPASAVSALVQPAGPGRRYRAVASDPESGLAYAVADDGLWAFDPEGRGPARRLLASTGLQAVLADVQGRRLLVSDAQAGAVLALDAQSGREVARATGLLNPSGLAIYGERVFVAETGADRVVVLDRRTCGIMKAEPVGGAPYALAVDPRWGRVWVANAGGSTVSVLDARTGVPAGAVRLGGLGHPQGIAVDQRRGRVYLTYLLTPRHHALAVVNAATLEIERILAGDDAQPLLGAYGVAVEGSTGRIFLSDVSGLLALDPQTLVAQTVQPGPGFVPPFGLAVDAATGRVIAAGDGAVRVLNGR